MPTRKLGTTQVMRCRLVVETLAWLPVLAGALSCCFAAVMMRRADGSDRA